MSITRLRLRSWRNLLRFFVAAFQSVLQARRAKGNLAVSTLREAHNTFWTCPLWTDEAAMKFFMESGRTARSCRNCSNGATRRPLCTGLKNSAQEPTWEEAHQRMQRDGRASRVSHPSEAHRRFYVPAPQVRSSGDPRFR